MGDLDKADRKGAAAGMDNDAIHLNKAVKDWLKAEGLQIDDNAINLTKGVVVAIDDDATNLTKIREILGSKYDVRLCKSGKMALVVLAETKADLILLDVEMPGMTGFDLMDEMKARFPDMDIPVIFVTSHATPQFVSLAVRQGAKGYIVKPFEPGTLLTKVQEVLNEIN
ncbi:MAG: response regulator [Synergistaceae bacterium]|nr:response regulator [Synergistaceae bacterium]